MKVAPMGEVRNNFARFLSACEGEPVFVTRNGRITAVLEHITDEQIEDFLLERNPRFRSMLNRVKLEKGGMTLSQYRAARRL